ncbi:MAG: IS1595 family transposase [Armatimonadetes bacterium]|nr:IS1595 family transposase [Armatimonadota bacterium]
MSQENRIPESLFEVVTFCADEQKAFEAMTRFRWPNGVACPHCGSVGVTAVAKRRIWSCKDCRKQFSTKTGTIFESSPISFSKWLPALWLIANAKNGISSCELARALSVTQKTAWFMLHRIRLAMQAGTFEKLSGTVEGDETFVGGKAKNMHLGKRGKIAGRGATGKTAVMGMMERGGQVKAFVVKDTGAGTLQGLVKAHVTKGSNFYTDHNFAYRGLKWEYNHDFVSHVEEYVRGEVHTQNLECFWNLLKRSIKGTYTSVDPWQLFRYVDEQVFRWNVRKMTDAERFATLASQVAGRRLTYRELTGKEYLPLQ